MSAKKDEESTKYLGMNELDDFGMKCLMQSVLGLLLISFAFGASSILLIGRLLQLKQSSEEMKCDMLFGRHQTN